LPTGNVQISARSTAECRLSILTLYEVSEMRNQRRGFTLVEVLVISAVVAVLLALFLPAVAEAQEEARKNQCKNHLKQMGLAMHNYHDVHKTFPPGWVAAKEDAEEGPFLGWVAA